MSTVPKVSEADYRRAKFIINNIASFSSVNSTGALAILRTSEKIIMLYHMQHKGIAPKQEISNSENIIDIHRQNVEIFLAARARQLNTK